MKKMNWKKLLSLALCLAMLVAWIPRTAAPAAKAASGVDSRVADPSTLDQWKQYFGVQTNHPNGVDLTTEFAGGIWTDKSVFAANDLPAELTRAQYNGNSFSMTDEDDNFLVALSAIGSNKQIAGYSTIPTDTVLILDLSSSMRYTDDNGGSAVDELVEATNKAITELLNLNKNNRVAVVVYAGNVNKEFNNAQGITTVVLPLDTYTTTKAGTYLEPKAVGRDANYALEVYSGVRNSSNASVSANRFEVARGTYMQDGIYEAMKLLLSADPVVQDGVQAGTTRLPIMVLMSDGEPTLGNPDYNGNDARTDLGTSTMYNYDGRTTAQGQNGQIRHRDTIAFVTSLTAAYAKKTVEAHYGTGGLMYTLAYGDSVVNLSEARSVLDPENASSVQNSLWNRFLAGETVRVYSSGSSHLTTANSSVAGEKLEAADRLYVDKYFAASNDDAMLKAFDSIVEEIIIQSMYYPTYVEKDHDHDGYLTFVDKIGEYMEVVDIKGIQVGGRLFSGAALAGNLNSDALGTVENPSAMGNAVVQSVKERLGIESTATARALLNSAFTHGQLSYTSDTQFSHYIGWFSDANGNYVDFWHEGMTGEQIATAQAKGATHIVKSYGFLGDTKNVVANSNTNMLYMSVRVSQDILTGDMMLTWQIPASLIPTITYEVEVEVDSDGKITGVVGLTATEAEPVRLIYEVALRSEITDWNMADVVDDGYAYKNADGSYTFYTNKWAADYSDTTRNTYSHFEPSKQNERYYYTQDIQVLVKSGEDYVPYTGSKPTTGAYYHGYEVYEKLGNTYRTHTHYEQISAEALSVAEAKDGGWVIPKDTIHRYYDTLTSEKASNPTGTMIYSDHPFVRSGNEYYTYSTQGNNGKLTATPATGIRLTKRLAEGYATNESFTFAIEGNVRSAEVVRLDENGGEKSRDALAANGQLTLAPGETVYIVGLAAGTCRVTELVAAGADYHVSQILVGSGTVSGNTAEATVAQQTVVPVEFINDKQGYGSLVVSKDVNYPAGFAPTAAHNAVTFTVDVTFSGDTAGMIAPTGAVVNGSTYTLSLKNGESVTFSNIKEGVSYTVAERAPSAGYSLQEIRYSDPNTTIVSAVTDQAHVVNSYAPRPVAANIKVQGTKTVTEEWPDNAEFTLRLWQEDDFASGTSSDTGLTATVTKPASGNAAGYEIDMSSITFDKVGTYYFRVIEDIPDPRFPDMAYDRTYGLFSVEVGDTDADGQLEILQVASYQSTGLSGDAQNGYVVEKDFVNVVTKDIVYLDVSKAVVNAADSSISYTDYLADITFGLFESMDSADPSYYILTDKDGKGTIAVPVTQASLGAGKTFYLREIAPAVENRVVGMRYDESWLYAVRITWDDADNKAAVEYAKVENGQVGQYAAYEQGQTVFAHTNTYEPSVLSTPAIVLSGNKTLNGGTDLGGREFSFSLYKTSAAFVIQGSALQTVKNSGNSLTFEGVRFDTPGLHYLSVKENASNLPGVTDADVHYHITVLVEKYVDTDGVTRLRVAQGYPTIHPYGATDSIAPDALDFDNTYKVSGEASVQISGAKVLTGRELLNGEFTFLLTEVADKDGAPKQDARVWETENDSATGGKANFTFEPIIYTEEGVHYYKVTEKQGPAGNGVTYSGASFVVKVEVKDNGLGGLDAQWYMADANLTKDALVFTNTYTPAAAHTELLSVKKLDGKVLEDGQFTFCLLQTNADFETAAPNGISREVKNTDRGIIDFGSMTYTEEGYYYYLIWEKLPDGDTEGISYDEARYRVTVQVVDNQEGQLVTFTAIEREETGDTVVWIPVSSVVFHNVYSVSDGAAVELKGEKTLENKTLEDGQFTFELYETGSDWATEGVTPATVTNKDGKFSFLLEFAPEDVGKTFYYVVREKNGGATVDGITYSDAVYRVQVTALDNGVGGVELEVECDDLTVTTDGNYSVTSNMEFVNVYGCAEEKLTLTVEKKMTGDSTDPSGYKFGLFLEPDGEPIATVTSDADGIVTIAELTVTLDDVSDTPYVAYIREIPGEAKKGLTYDTKAYKLEIKVADGGKGKLEVICSVDGKAVDMEDYRFVFTNHYEKPVEPTTPPAQTPETGDNMNFMVWALLLIGSATAIALLVFGKKVIK